MKEQDCTRSSDHR